MSCADGGAAEAVLKFREAALPARITMRLKGGPRITRWLRTGDPTIKPQPKWVHCIQHIKCAASKCIRGSVSRFRFIRLRVGGYRLIHCLPQFVFAHEGVINAVSRYDMLSRCPCLACAHACDDAVAGAIAVGLWWGR